MAHDQTIKDDLTIKSASAPKAPQDLLSGKYQILEQIGKGGMSVVYKARHALMGNLVAIKVLQDRLSDDAAYQKRFLLEAQSTIVLEDPNIIRVYDFGILDDGGSSYLVMEYIDGQSLSDMISKQHRLAPELAVPIFRQIAKGLAHAHVKGVLHRDLKPSNVLTIREPSPSGDELKVKVVDFGIAKMTGADGGQANLTMTGEVLGSPNYMSPEQCLGRAADARSDIYSMGCLMYEALTGQTPHTGTNVLETLHKHINEQPEPLTASLSHPLAKDLAVIVEHALEKDPERRYATFDALLEDLERIENGKTLASKPNSSRKIKIAAGVSIAIAAVATVAVWLGASKPQPSARSVEAPSAVPVRTVFKPTQKPNIADLKKMIEKMPIVRLDFLNLSDSDLDTLGLADRKDVTTINLRGNPNITSIGASKLLKAPLLTKLHLDGTSVDDKFLSEVSKASQLQTLTLGNTKVTSGGFRFLRPLANLQELWLNELHLADKDTRLLPPMNKLVSINLDENRGISNETIGTLVDRSPNCQLWAIRSCPNIDERAPLIFVKFAHAKHVSAFGSGMNPRTATAILRKRGIGADFTERVDPGSSQDALRRAKAAQGNGNFEPRDPAARFVSQERKTAKYILTAVACNVRFNARLQPDELAYLASLPTRTSLNFEGTLADESLLDGIQNHIGDVDYVSIGQTQIKPQSFRKLAGAAKLRHLEINGLNLSDADLDYLPSLPNLSIIRLDANEKLTAAGIAKLAGKFPELHKLAIRFTTIGDEIVPELATFPKLAELHARGSKVTTKAQQELRGNMIDVVLEKDEGIRYIRDVKQP